MEEEYDMYDDEEQVMQEMRELAAAQHMAAQQELEQHDHSQSHTKHRQPPTIAASPAAAPPLSQPPSSAGARSFFQNSPALSQISSIHGSDDTAGPAVNRRLFGTPHPSNNGAARNARIASTPFGAFGTPAAGAVSVYPTEVGAEPVASRKRRLEDLFGDIADIAGIDDDDHDDDSVAHGGSMADDRDRLYNALAKRARTEEQIDLEMIEQILERRKQRLAAANAVNPLNLDRLEALHRFKQLNLSYALPRWPYTTLRRGAGADRERMYVRMHSEEFERAQIEEAGRRSVGGGGGMAGLLGAAREETWTKAQEIINDRLTAAAKRLLERENNAVPPPAPIDEVSAMLALPTADGQSALWVEKYRPDKYVDLLSDETTNRSLLSWLKMWDKVVFNRDFKPDPVVAKPGMTFGGSGAASSSSSSSSTAAAAAAAAGANTFNKKTGKFEPFGRYRGGGPAGGRRAGAELRTERDEHGRPQQKVVLLCGPPGLGKTTLAHTIARHAGYTVRELNASDDRSAEAFRQALENGTQMQPLLTDRDRSRPNCIVLDEIDGAPAPAIEFLCKFLTDTATTAAASKAPGGKARKPTLLRRPVICICNDLYAPALRPLRQLAFIVHFSALNASRLAERLAQIARRERMRADMAALLALAEKTGNDVRACLAVLQFHRGLRRPLTLLDVLNSAVGQKDRQRGLFAVWSSIFQIQRPQKTLAADEMHTDGRQVVTMTDMSAATRAKNVLDAVHMGGDYDRLMQGVHENYLTQKMPDPNMRGVAEATDWFCFADRLRQHLNRTQNYSVYGYQQFGFVAWHFLFGSLVWPKIGFPSRGAEFARKSITQRQVEASLRRGFTASSTCGIGGGPAVLLDTVPLLRHVLCPQLRSVSLQLLSPKERSDLRHTVEVMVDLGLMYVQTKSADGTYQYQMEPNINMLGTFDVLGGNAQLAVSYTGRQIIAREVELEKMRRVVPKEAASAGVAKSNRPLPNHLQTLPKPTVPRVAGSSRLRETVTKDFFGRLSSKQTLITVQEGGTDLIVKSPIWYRYKEGCNNAVRKDVTIANLL